MNGIVASRLVERFNRPVVLIARSADGLEGIGSLDLDVRPPRGARRVCRPSRALRRAPRRRGAVDRDGAAGVVPRGVRGARRRRPGRRRPSPGDDDRRDRAGPRADARPRARSSTGSRRSGSATPSRRCSSRASRPSPRARWGRGSTSASGSASTSGTAARRSRSGSAGQLDRIQRPGRYDVAFRLKENRWNGTVAPQLVVRRVFDAADDVRRAPDVARRAVACGRGVVDARRARDLRGARARRRKRAAASSWSRGPSGPCSSATRWRCPKRRSAAVQASPS